MIDECPWHHPSTITAARTIGCTTPIVRSSTLLKESLHTSCKLMLLGDGAYWAPHDEEALKLDNLACAALPSL